MVVHGPCVTEYDMGGPATNEGVKDIWALFIGISGFVNAGPQYTDIGKMERHPSLHADGFRREGGGAS